MWQVSVSDSPRQLPYAAALPLYGHDSRKSVTSTRVNQRRRFVLVYPSRTVSLGVKSHRRYGLGSRVSKMFQADSTRRVYELDSQLSSLCKQFRRK